MAGEHSENLERHGKLKFRLKALEISKIIFTGGMPSAEQNLPWEPA